MNISALKILLKENGSRLAHQTLDGMNWKQITFNDIYSNIEYVNSYLTKNQIIKISDRNNIGCDQVIFIDQDKNHDAFLKFYNSDGGEISACGNGSRCVAKLICDEKKIEHAAVFCLLYTSPSPRD